MTETEKKEKGKVKQRIRGTFAKSTEYKYIWCADDEHISIYAYKSSDATVRIYTSNFWRKKNEFKYANKSRSI